MQEDLLQIRSLGVNFYVLRDSSGLYLIDAGFIGGRQLLHQALKKRGWVREPIMGIIVTHGHLDHILHVGRIAEETGAWIAAPRLDASHYQGCPTYQGASIITGLIEAIGRPLLGFRKFTPTRLLDDGDVLDIWHGLTVVHLPGTQLVIVDSIAPAGSCSSVLTFSPAMAISRICHPWFSTAMELRFPRVSRRL